tara:strand:+ start:131 stop:559 length:429 start_codon:yes stop_codon:yes gene_type:complete
MTTNNKIRRRKRKTQKYSGGDLKPRIVYKAFIPQEHMFDNENKILEKTTKKLIKQAGHDDVNLMNDNQLLCYIRNYVDTGSKPTYYSKKIKFNEIQSTYESVKKREKGKPSMVVEPIVVLLYSQTHQDYQKIVNKYNDLLQL